MACDNNWTIKFLGVNEGDNEPFEVRPITMSLKQSRHQYDFCRAKLSREVGEMMKPHTRYAGGELYGYTRVVVEYNGLPIAYLVFRPDWVDYGSEFTHIKLKDLHKALSNGTIDQQYESVELKSIYETVVDSASNDFINTVKLNVPDNQPKKLHGYNAFMDDPLADSPGELNSFQDSLKDAKENRDEDAWDTGLGKQEFIEELGESIYGLPIDVIQDDSQKIINSSLAVNFNEISPELALRKLNKRFRLKTWVNRKGELIVGIPEATSNRHLAAPGDERVWRYKDPNISHGREPIHSVIVEGPWVDEPGVDLSDAFDWFDEGGMADVRAMGIAKRTDIDYGTRFTVKAHKAKKDALPQVADFAIRERMKQQNAGTVEIDPELSGEGVSTLIDVMSGDLLQLVPNDEFYENPTATSGIIGDSPDYPDKVCGDFVNNEVYLISEVEHNVTESGEWQVHLDLGMYADVPINSYMNYFDPANDEWIDDSEINSDGDLAGGLFAYEGDNLFNEESI